MTNVLLTVRTISSIILGSIQNTTHHRRMGSRVHGNERERLRRKVAYIVCSARANADGTRQNDIRFSFSTLSLCRVRVRVCVARKNDSFEASIKTSCSQATRGVFCVRAFVFAEREGGAGADSTAVHGMVGHHTLRQIQQYSALCDDWKLPTTRDGS